MVQRNAIMNEEVERNWNTNVNKKSLPQPTIQHSIISNIQDLKIKVLILNKKRRDRQKLFET